MQEKCREDQREQEEISADPMQMGAGNKNKKAGIKRGTAGSGNYLSKDTANFV